jgi:hypothetical protein
MQGRIYGVFQGKQREIRWHKWRRSRLPVCLSSAGRTAHHLKQLKSVGVLRIAEERKGARRPAVVYAMVGDQLSSAQAVKTEHGRKTYSRAAARVADAGARAFSAAVAHGAPITQTLVLSVLQRHFQRLNILHCDK